jgi:hypothetical protein
VSSSSFLVTNRYLASPVRVAFTCVIWQGLSTPQYEYFRKTGKYTGYKWCVAWLDRADWAPSTDFPDSNLHRNSILL